VVIRKGEFLKEERVSKRRVEGGERIPNDFARGRG